MKRLEGNFLIALSIVCLTMTVPWTGSGLADMPDEPSKKNG
jgi:hypothetical protein